jgi:hypothetical protein
MPSLWNGKPGWTDSGEAHAGGAEKSLHSVGFAIRWIVLVVHMEM